MATRHFIYTYPTSNAPTPAQTPLARMIDMDLKVAAFELTLPVGSTLVSVADGNYNPIKHSTEFVYVYTTP